MSSDSFVGEGLNPTPYREAMERVRELEADRDSWAQQADDRCKDAVEALQRAERAEAENERLRQALKQFAECDLNDSNCSGLPVAVARIRNIARAALAGEKP